MRTPLAITFVLLAILVPVGFLTEDEGSPAQPAVAPVETIARRVEALRGQRFRRMPDPRSVTAAEARDAGLKDLDRGYPAERRRADEALYTLLGLLEPGTDLREVSGSIFGEQVAGYYDSRKQELAIVEGAGTGNRVISEMVIAHELDHALEDQVFELETERAERSDDPGYAYLALVEGSASSLMYEYLDRHFRADVALGGLFGGAFGGGTGDLPAFVVEGLTFPYVQGEAFVDDLRRRAGGRWDLVDLALRRRPPVSTEQVLHPGKWVRVEAPERVRLRGLSAALGDGHERLTAGVFGEFQTGALLALSGRRRAEAAAGWGGDRYELWRRGAGGCETPCTGRDVLAMRWSWDTRRDADEFAAALRATIEDGFTARPDGRGGWTWRGGAVAMRATGRQVTLALAPEAPTARRVAYLSSG